MKRRNFIATTTSASAVAFAPAKIGANVVALGNAAPSTIPITGPPVPELGAFDRVMVAVLEKWSVPGGQCAVAKDGKLVFARGFGHVDAVRPGLNPPPVSPTARFRIASSTKPITAVTILRLIEMRKLGLEERAFDILNDFTPPPGTTPDPRLHTITVRQLLEHSGGFQYPNAAGFDPQFDGLRLCANTFGHPYPASTTDIIRWAMGKPLAFTPGTDYVYSNLGYNILGRIIERRTQLPYQTAVKKLVLDPAGVRRFAYMTRSSPQARLSDEVFYVDGPQYLDAYSIYDDDAGIRQYAYGGFDGTAIDAHGGGISNAPDLTRFLDAVAGSTGFQLLKPATVKTMLTRPNIPHWDGNGEYYALGWNVNPAKNVVMGHNGAITYGTESSIFRLANGVTVAAIFNHLDPNIGGMLTDIVDGLIAAASTVKQWPANDLYPAVG